MKDNIICKYYILINDIQSNELYSKNEAIDFAIRMKEYFDDVKVIQCNYKIVLSTISDSGYDLSYLDKEIIYGEEE